MIQSWFRKSIAVAGILSLSLLSTMALAHDSTARASKLALTADQVANKTAIETERGKADSEARQLRQEAKVQKRLEQKQLMACEKVEAKIKSKTDSLVKRAEKQLAAFDRISEKVQKFATDKAITIADLDDLLAQTKAARDKVTADLDALKADATSFECDATNPKGIGQAIKADAKLIRTDLKAYRLTVRHLIQAVRQANGQNRDAAEKETSTDGSTSESNDSTTETDTTTNSPVGAQ